MKEQCVPAFNDAGGYEGTRFFIEVNEAAEEGGSVTMHVIHSTNCERTNKRHIRAYLTSLGEPVWNHKRIMREVWGLR